MAGKRISITNIHAGGDYTAAIQVGSRQAAANVILDTGSSTLAVKRSTYKPQQDGAIKATQFAQEITYGTGGWAGPVITTKVALGGVGLAGGIVAVALDQEPHNFGPADGILGLAYDSLNDCYDLSAYLRHQGINPPETYPWPFPARNSLSAIEQFAKLFGAMPKKTLTPFFTQLVDANEVANKFAFYTRRSVPHATRGAENEGYFILGGGEEQEDLYQGNFVNVDVVHDQYYNTTLKAVQVGHAPPKPAEPLPPQFKAMGSNSVVDSGTNSLALAATVFQGIIAALDPGLANIAKRALQSPNGVANAEVDIPRWPAITFTLQGERGEDVPLVCTPQTY